MTEDPAKTVARAKPVTRAEYEELKRSAARAQSAAEKAEAAAKETHDKIADIHKALMVPFPGQDKSLLDRMAVVTINVESGGRVAALAVRIAAVLAAIGAVWAMITAFGTPK